MKSTKKNLKSKAAAIKKPIKKAKKTSPTTSKLSCATQDVDKNQIENYRAFFRYLISSDLTTELTDETP